MTESSATIRPTTGGFFDRSTPTLSGASSSLTFSKVTMGRAHACALAGNDLYCWGSNWAGQVGDGITTTRVQPTMVPGKQFVDVGAGDEFTCALDTNRYTWCWGYNFAYRLGNGGTVSSSSPVQPTGIGTTPMAEVAVGLNATCARRMADSALMCWGANGGGQAGVGSTTPQSTPLALSGAYASVTMGRLGGCAIATPSQVVHCWGTNDDGLVGDGTWTLWTSPVPVSGSLTAKQVVAAYGARCAITMAGTTKCWGPNSYGNVGDGTTTTRNVPTDTTDTTHFRSLFTGNQARGLCGLTDGTDLPRCWGKTVAGQLNNATVSPANPTPVAVNHAQTYVHVATGTDFACGLTTTGEVWCWGESGNGQSGAWTTVGTPAKVSGALSFTQIAAGDAHACGVTSTNAAYCWGSNESGELGDNSTSNSATLKLVQPGASSGSFTSITAGYDHTCAIESVSSNIYCWGNNSSGELGRASGNTTSSLTPVRVANTNAYSQVSAGRGFTCALQSSTVDCWGSSRAYQTGQGSTAMVTVPTAVSGSYTSVRAGAYHACAIKADATLSCWGSSGVGRLALSSGDGHTPSPAGAGKTFSEISPGYTHTCGKLSSAAEMWCAGYDGAGQLGSGTVNESDPKSSTMSLVTGSHTWNTSGGVTALSLGAFASTNCAMDSINALYCWGRNLTNNFGTLSTTYENVAVPMRFLSAHASSVSQHDANNSVVSTGSSSYGTTVNLVAQVSDLEPTDTAKFCVEVKAVGSSFDGSGLQCSTASTNGSSVSVPVTGLSSGTGYHRRWQMQSTLYGKQLFQIYGNNAENAADFTPDNVVPTVASLSQKKNDGTTSITAGSYINETTVKFSAIPTDATSTVQLCIRYADVNSTSYTTLPCSTLAASGNAATVVASSLAQGQHHWQAQAIDAVGNASSWVDFNGNGSTVRDVGVDTTAPGVPTSVQQYKADGTTVLSTRAWTNETTLKVRATASDATTTVQWCARLHRQSDNAMVSQDCSALGASPYTATITFASIPSGQQYWWEYWAKDAAGNTSSTTTFASPSFGVDTTAPTAGSVYDGLNAPTQESLNDGSLTSLSASWNGFSDSLAMTYEYAVGTTSGGTDVQGWTNRGTNTSVTVTGLSLRTGQLYYVAVRATDAASNVSQGQMVAPSLTFTAGATTADFGTLASPTYSSTADITFTTSTNGYNGYVITTKTSTLLTGPVAIPQNVGGTWASPTASPGDGLAYSASGPMGYAVTKFNNGTNWAAMPTDVGEIFGDHPTTVTGTPITNEAFVLKLRLQVSPIQAAGQYSGTITVTNTVGY